MLFRSHKLMNVVLPLAAVCLLAAAACPGVNPAARANARAEAVGAARTGAAGDPVVTFTGRGRAHGVGLCMDGVLYRARNAGHGYRDIINYYYTGVAFGRSDENQPIRVKCRDGVVRTYPMKQYLYHLQEEPETYPAEGLKVLYVAARTYTLSCIARGKHAKEGFDICSSGGCCQAFDENKDLTKYPNNCAAVDATAGEILTYNGQVITSAYCGSCGGHTENNEDVWGGSAIQYLRGKPDDYCKYSSRYAWTVQMKKSEVEAKLNGSSDTAVGTLYSFDLSNRTPGGRVAKARINGSGGTKTVSGSTLSGRLGLQSSMFDASFEQVRTSNFDEFILVLNPNAQSAVMTFTFMQPDGNSTNQIIEVAGNSRFTLRVNDYVPLQEVSTRVVSDIPVICERAMYFNYRAGVRDWTGGHDVLGTNAPAKTFYFAEGTCRPNFDPYICIQNPGDGGAEVRITYMKGDGTTTDQMVTVNAYSRTTVEVKGKLGEGDDSAHDFSAKVECTNGQAIIAERPMYFNYQGYTRRNWTGGHDVLGTNAPAKTFYFAEGTCRPNFDPYICIQNPGDGVAEVRITYMKGDGTTTDQMVTVKPHSRSTVVVKDELGEGDDSAHDFSAKVECTNGQAIVAERPMYFNRNGVTGGSDVSGVTGASGKWFFAEGYTGGTFDTFVLIQNPDTRAAQVRVSFIKLTGTVVTKDITVNPQTRYTLPIDSLEGMSDVEVSTTVESLNGVGIIAERAMYFNYQGKWSGGHDTAGSTALSSQWYFAEGYTGN